MSTTHVTLTREQDWDTTVKNSWRNGTTLQQELFLKQQPSERQMWNLHETTSVKPWWNHGEPLVGPADLFGSPPGSQNLENLGGTLVKPSWDTGELGGALLERW